MKYILSSKVFPFLSLSWMARTFVFHLLGVLFISKNASFRHCRLALGTYETYGRFSFFRTDRILVLRYIFSLKILFLPKGFVIDPDDQPQCRQQCSLQYSYEGSTGLDRSYS